MVEEHPDVRGLVRRIPGTGADLELEAETVGYAAHLLLEHVLAGARVRGEHDSEAAAGAAAAATRERECRTQGEGDEGSQVAAPRHTLAFRAALSYQCATCQPRSPGVRSLTAPVALAVLGLVVVASAAPAQRRIRGGRAVLVEQPSIGPRLGYDFDVSHLFLGGQLNLPVGVRWALVPSAEFYPGLAGSLYRLNADLKYHPPTTYGFFYFGGGFAYLHASGVGHGGGNVFAGWEGRRARPFKPFLEGKFVFSTRTSFNLETGLDFPL